ncbi:MAG: amino acid adenylation domain-containing protein [Candidatus Aminicenantes bacterium]|nr:MAG: amino acid adenylation domain-containing protein [Candidatus Aminicenantes bacterium]
MKIPTSYHQERLWFIDKFENGYLYESSPIYHNIPLILNIEGPLDIEILEKSIQDVINRHEALRTRIVNLEDKPYQWVNQTVNFSLSILDLTGDGHSGGYDRAISCAFEEINQPFVLHEGPLIRGKLIRFESRQFIFVITIHHIIADRYSLNILLEEIFLYYKGYLKKQPLKLPDLSIHYADFSQWQRSLSVKFMESLLSYWKSKISAKLQALELPLDRPRALVHTYQGKGQSISFPKGLCDRIKAFSKQEKTSNFITLLAAFKALLYRYTAHDEIVVGINAENRSQPGLEKIIGPISNLLVIRDYLSTELPFREFICEVDKTVKDAYKHQYMPFDKLALEINPAIDMSRTVFFDVLFQYEDTPHPLPPVGDLKITIVETNLGWGKYDLNILVQDKGESFSGILVYNSDIFSESTISRMIEHYLVLLKRILENPAQAISSYSVLTDREKNQLLTKWNQLQVHYPENKTIHELFAEQAARTPDEIAGKGPGFSGARPVIASISYRQLNNKSDQLAELLKAKGVKPDTIVGILLERSLVMIAAIIGILKAGGAYLPIEPGYPGKRVTYMLDDSHTSLLLTQKELVKEIRFKGEAIDLINEKGYPSAAGDLSSLNVPADAAYVIYTSGTTGEPKGAVIEHRNVVRLLFNDNNPFDFDSHDVWTMFHSYGFDFSVWEMYGSLLYGGKLIIIPKMMAMDPTGFLQVLTKEKVTVLNQTPTAFYALIDEELKKPGGELNLRYVIFGGEALKPAKLKEWKEKYPGTQLINMYGITETTVHVTYKEITDQEIKSNQSNIGKPIPTLTAYVMERGLKLLPLGIPGELCVGGEGVCRGYLNRPGLTHQKFTRNPYKKVERLYCSGDLVKLQQTGEMEYLGRIDHQVKIRGHRIELGEIESQLLNHIDIKEAVVMVRTNPNSDKYICAYIVSQEELTVSQLRSYLSEGLPDYMLPSFSIKMDAIPLTPNGKVDRKALPAPEISIGKGYIAPQTKLEKKLVEIWSDVLGLEKEKISTEANFFELGGHSLKAVTMLSGIHKTLNVNIPLVELFRTPTIKGLSQYIKKAEEDQYIAIEPVEKKDYYSLSSAQKRLYILDQVEEVSTAYNIFGAFTLEGEWDAARLEAALRKLLQKHESFRTSFVMVEEEPVQRIHDNVEFAIEYDCAERKAHSAQRKEERQAPGAVRCASTIKNFVRPFDLSRAPLLRVGLMPLENKKYLLMADMHHIISDGVSAQIFVKEFAALFAGKELPLLRIQYKDYSNWHNIWIESAEFKKQEQYWLNRFTGDIPVLNIPLSYTRPKVRNYEGDEVNVVIEGNLMGKLERLMKKTGTTLYMILLAVCNLSLYKYTGQEDIIIGSVTTGRSHTELENIVGFFINMHAMRNRVKGEKLFLEFLEEVKKNTIDALDNQDYPFDELVSKLGIKRESNRYPLVDVVFQLQNIPFQPVELTQLQVSPYPYNHSLAKFDLYFEAFEMQNAISINIQYATSLFTRAAVEKMAKNYLYILNQVLDNENTRLEQIKILPGVSAAASNPLQEDQGDFGF